MTRASVRYAKEALTITCEELTRKASERLDWDKFEETSGNLTQGERDCLEQLLPQVRIAAELFRQCSKNKETGNGKRE
jgi:hypothetical protein